MQIDDTDQTACQIFLKDLMHEQGVKTTKINMSAEGKWFFLPENKHWMGDGVEVFASDLRDSIVREVLRDLRHNSGTVITTDKLDCNIQNACQMINKKTLQKGKFWVAGTKKNVEQFICDKRFDENHVYIHPQLFESNSAFSFVLVDDMLSSSEVVVGMKGDQFGSGYFYCPYIGNFIIKPIHTEDFCSLGGIATRYAKWLAKSGSKYYARVQLKN